MSLHLPANKPRSIRRQLPTYSSQCTIHAPIPPSLEQSLDEWLSRTSSSNSVSSDVSNDLGTYGNNYSHCLTQSAISTSPTTYTVSSDLQQEHQQQQPTYPCLCCQLPQCTAWKRIIKVTRKLETETRLAAEVGQSLLQTNEAYKVESDKLKEQVKQCQEQKYALEISLDDAERLTRQLELEKDKWMWKYEKSQKILDESAADLETANNKSASLTEDIEQLKLEMDKLQQLKIKSHQFSTRQDILESKVQDMKQELMISRKNKLALESKNKKLTTQYEILSSAYQEMCKESSNKKFVKGIFKPLSSITPPTASDIEHADTNELVAFIKDLVTTNNELKSELFTTSTQLTDLRNEMNLAGNHSFQYNNNNIINNESKNNNGVLLTKHLNSVNKKMAPPDLLGRRTATGDGRSRGQKATTPVTATLNTKARQRSTPLRVSKSKSTKETRRASTSNKCTVVSPQKTISSPVVHHHYHYYTDVRQQNINNADKNVDIGNSTLTGNMDKGFSTLYMDKTGTIDTNSNTETTIIHPGLELNPTTTPICNISQQTHNNGTNTNSSNYKIHLSINILPSHAQEPILSSLKSAKSSLSVTSSTEINDNARINAKGDTVATSATPTPIPTHYTTLMNQAKAILQRIHATDPRTINRRLQRAFDIGELSNMSNSLLQNIMADVDTMYARFFWLTPDENDDDADNGDGSETTNECNNSDFLLMVKLSQEFLLEISQLSMIINHLQVAYVKKVQENEIQAEHRHYESTSATAAVSSNESTVPLPSLLSSGNTSCNSFSTKSLDSFTTDQHGNTVPTTNWFSSLFIGNRSSVASFASDTRDSHIEGPLVNESKQHHQQQQQQQQSKPKSSTSHNLRLHYRQQHGLRRSNDDKSRFWPSIYSMMDTWNQRLPMENASSSYLDREWRWSCSDTSH